MKFLSNPSTTVIILQRSLSGYIDKAIHFSLNVLLGARQWQLWSGSRRRIVAEVASLQGLCSCASVDSNNKNSILIINTTCCCLLHLQICIAGYYIALTTHVQLGQGTETVCWYEALGRYMYKYRSCLAYLHSYIQLTGIVRTPLTLLTKILTLYPRFNVICW